MAKCNPEECPKHELLEEKHLHVLDRIEELSSRIEQLTQHLIVGVKVSTTFIGGAITLVLALFCYSSFVQVPALRVDMAKELAAKEKADLELTAKVDRLNMQTADIITKLAKLEPK